MGDCLCVVLWFDCHVVTVLYVPVVPWGMDFFFLVVVRRIVESIESILRFAANSRGMRFGDIIINKLYIEHTLPRE